MDEEVKRLAEQSQYHGALRPHLVEILRMHFDGLIPRKIAERLVSEYGVKPPYWYPGLKSEIENVGGLVRHAISRSIEHGYGRQVVPGQAAWERRQAIRRLRDSGLSVSEIGALIGRSEQRVRQIISRAEREQRSPAEKYFAQKVVQQFPPATMRVLNAMSILPAATKQRDWLLV